MSLRIRWALALAALFLLAGLAHYRIAVCHGERSYDTAVALNFLCLARNGWQPSGLVGTTAFGDHFNPLFLAALPVYLLSPTALALQLFKSAVYILGLVGLARLARLRLGPGAGAWAATLTAAGPLFWNSLLADYHSETLAAALLPWLLLAYERRRLSRCLLLAAVVCLGKENLPLVVGGLGVLALHERRSPHWWLSLGALGFAVFALGLLVILPAATPPGAPNLAALRFGRLASASGWIAALSDPGLWRWLGVLGVSCGGLCFLAPRSLWPLIPLLLQHGLSAWALERSLDFHYLAPVLPLLVAGALRGLARLPRRWWPRSVVLLLAIQAVLLVAYGPAERLRALRRQHGAAHLAARLPARAPAWASVSTAARLAARPRLYLAESLLTGTFPSRTWPLSLDPRLRTDPPRHGLLDVRDRVGQRLVPVPRGLHALDAVGDLVLLGPRPPERPPVRRADSAPARGWFAAGGCELRAGEGGRYWLRVEEIAAPGLIQLRLTAARGRVLDERLHRPGLGLTKGPGIYEVRYLPPLRFAGVRGAQRLYARSDPRSGWRLLSTWER